MTQKFLFTGIYLAEVVFFLFDVHVTVYRVKFPCNKTN